MPILFAIIVSFGKVGLTSLGGGNSMLKLIEYEAVSYRHWVGPDEFIGMLGSSFLFPGLTAIKLAALIGYKAAGMPGLLLATICLNLPGLLLALIGYQWLNHHDNPTTRKIMVGVQYGSLALLAAAAYGIAEGVIRMHYSLPIVLLWCVFFLSLIFLQIPPFWGFLVFISVCFFMVH